MYVSKNKHTSTHVCPKKDPILLFSSGVCMYYIVLHQFHVNRGVSFLRYSFSTMSAENETSLLTRNGGSKIVVMLSRILTCLTSRSSILSLRS